MKLIVPIALSAVFLSAALLGVGCALVSFVALLHRSAAHANDTNDEQVGSFTRAFLWFIIAATSLGALFLLAPLLTRR